MVTENPRGFSLAQKTEPPHCSMLFLMMASPRPEPPGCLRCASAPRKKGSVSEGSSASGTPSPESTTRSSTALSTGRNPVRTRIGPFGARVGHGVAQGVAYGAADAALVPPDHEIFGDVHADVRIRREVAPQIREQGQEEHFLTGCGLRRGLGAQKLQHVVGQLRQVVQLPHDAANALPVFSLGFLFQHGKAEVAVPERRIELVGDVPDELALPRHLLVQAAGHGAERPAQAAYLILPRGIDGQGRDAARIPLGGDAFGIVGHAQEGPRKVPDERGPPQAGQADDPERHKQRQPEAPAR